MTIPAEIENVELMIRTMAKISVNMGIPVALAAIMFWELAKQVLKERNKK